MNNRDYKTFVPGSFYHIFNRGNGKQDIFRDEDDFVFFLFRLKENLFPLPVELSLDDRHQGMRKNKSHTPYLRKTLPADSFDLICYCLMPNHFHFLIKPNKDISVAKLISKVCTGYSKYFNKKYNHAGHVFQDKFRSVLVDSDTYLKWLSAYIHNNPKTAGLSRDLKNYKWSSYPDYLNLRPGNLCKNDIILSAFKNLKAYEKFVEESGKLILQRKELEDLLIDQEI